MQSSSDCYPGFGVDTDDITLYNSPPQYPVNPNSAQVAFDMTEACTWSLPICDYNTWHASLKGQGPPSSYSLSDSDNLINAAWYCAYNMDMVPESDYCSTQVSYTGGRASEPIYNHGCQSWPPSAKVFNLVPSS